MAGLNAQTPNPVELTLHAKSRVLEIAFDDGARFRLPFELLRVLALGRGPGPRPGPGDAADRKARGRHHRARAGRPLRGQADLSPTAMTPASFLGLPVHGSAPSRSSAGATTWQGLQAAGLDRDAPHARQGRARLRPPPHWKRRYHGQKLSDQMP